MKIGVISDTHAHRLSDIPEAIPDALSDIDLIAHAGDITDLTFLQELQKLGPPVEAVCGNMCSSKVRSALPEKKIFEAGGKRIGLTHGTGGRANIVLRVQQMFSGVDIIIFGHSHEAYSKIVDGVLLFNPGQAFRSFGILTIENGKIEPKIVRLR